MMLTKVTPEFACQRRVGGAWGQNPSKKPRMVWTAEYCARFVEAVNHLVCALQNLPAGAPQDNT